MWSTLNSSFLLQVLGVLLEFGAIIDMKDVLGQDALFIAANNGRVRAVEELLRCGADPLRLLYVDLMYEKGRSLYRGDEHGSTVTGNTRQLRRRRMSLTPAESSTALALCIRTRPAAAAKILDTFMEIETATSWTFEVGVEFLRLEELLVHEVIQAVHDSGHFRLLEHQVLRQIERAMWSKYGRRVFITRFGLYLVFASLTSFAVAVGRQSERDAGGLLVLVGLLQPLNFFYLHMAFDAICCKQYASRLRHTRFYYVDIITHCLVLGYSLFVATCVAGDCPDQKSDSWVPEVFDCLAASTVILVWIKCCKYLLVDKHTGPLVIVLFTILSQDLLQFILLSLVFFIGYTFAFYIVLWRSLSEFGSPWLSSVSTVNMFFWHGNSLYNA